MATVLKYYTCRHSLHRRMVNAIITRKSAHHHRPSVAIAGPSIIMAQGKTHVPPHASARRNNQASSNDNAAGPGGQRGRRANSSAAGKDRVRDGRDRDPRAAGRGRGGGGGRGRGRGRGRHKKHSVTIETADFRTKFHAEVGAAKYKVHAPLCSCPKIVKLRQRYLDANDNNAVASSSSTLGNTTTDATTNQDAGNNAKNNSASAYSNRVQLFDVDGNISHRLSELNISPDEKAERNNNDNSNDDVNGNADDTNPFDNLIVVPDTKSPQAIYACEGTDGQSFRTDAFACERKIANDIFGNSVADGGSQEKVVTPTKNAIPFKVNCAICLLTEHQRNGFAAIVSDDFAEIETAIERARGAIEKKVRDDGRELHADHAHFVCALELRSLRSLLKAGETRGRDRRASTEIATRMIYGGVDLQQADASSMQIKMGHHLTSLLYLLDNDNNKPQQSSSSKNNHIMVMGYIDGPQLVELDLPGGKRHLGESTLDGAIREVEEECSLRINRDWFAERVSERYGGSLSAGDKLSVDDTDEGVVYVMEPKKVRGMESGDAFFVMSPPPRVGEEVLYCS